MKLVDDFLNNITMYRLVLYFLILLAAVGLIYSLTGVLSFDPINYVFSFTFLLVASGIANRVFAKTYGAHANVESWIISALILGLIIAPPKSVHEVIFLGFAALLMVASKFILAIGRKHIFNPVAISIAVTAIAINGAANWWVGVSSMLPIVAIGSFLVIRKIRRWDLVLSFLGMAFLVIIVSAALTRSNLVNTVIRSIVDLPLIFFAGVMLTEPLTTPPTRGLRIWYGAIIGFLISPQVHFGTIFFTPELALIIGNIFSYIVSPKYKLVLRLRDKIQFTPDTYDFVFVPDRKINFTPGQYMEWTLEHPKSDDRGNRRYLSLASSPTEQEIRIGVKVGSPPSSFKKSLVSMTPGQTIVAGQLIGDFTMPKDVNKKLVFMAGGIGITPFRSMAKYLIDKNEKRDIVVLYAEHDSSDFVYKDIFGKIKTIYASSDTQRIDSGLIAREVPDYQNRIFYLSGSNSVVKSFEEILGRMGVSKGHIVKDYFPGFA